MTTATNVKEITIAEIPDYDDATIRISAKIIDKTGSTIILGDSTGTTTYVADPYYAQWMDIGKWYRITTYAVSGALAQGVTITPSPIDAPADATINPMMITRTTPVGKIDNGGIRPGTRVDLRVSVTLWDARSPKIHQTGLIADDTGRIPFTVWANRNRQPVDLVAGRTYQICGAKIDMYNGRYRTDITNAIITDVTPGAVV